jgi:hypothetical protein
MSEEVNPLKPIKVHLKSEEEITEGYRDRLRRKQTKMDPHVFNRKIDEE